MNGTVFAIDIKEVLEGLYKKYNRREYVHPDPLEFLYYYEDPADREITGLIAASLAYGRVEQILKSVSSVLEKMPRPKKYLLDNSREKFESDFLNFKHRFTGGHDMASLLYGMKKIIERYGSLNECFVSGMKAGDETVIPAVGHFVSSLKKESGVGLDFLLPLPEKGSACKRLNLYLRWMTRKDDVDPGGWEGVPASGLVIPLDTHMYQICGKLGMTRRKQADLKCALEITDAFRKIEPGDPVKYDFAITRMGIRDDCDLKGFLSNCGITEESGLV